MHLYIATWNYLCINFVFYWKWLVIFKRFLAALIICFIRLKKKQAANLYFYIICYSWELLLLIFCGNKSPASDFYNNQVAKSWRLFYYFRVFMALSDDFIIIYIFCGFKLTNYFKPSNQWCIIYSSICFYAMRWNLIKPCI